MIVRYKNKSVQKLVEILAQGLADWRAVGDGGWGLNRLVKMGMAEIRAASEDHPRQYRLTESGLKFGRTCKRILS